MLKDVIAKNPVDVDLPTSSEGILERSPATTEDCPFISDHDQDAAHASPPSIEDQQAPLQESTEQPSTITADAENGGTSPRRSMRARIQRKVYDASSATYVQPFY